MTQDKRNRVQRIADGIKEARDLSKENKESINTLLSEQGALKDHISSLIQQNNTLLETLTSREQKLTERDEQLNKREEQLDKRNQQIDALIHELTASRQREVTLEGQISAITESIESLVTKQDLAEAGRIQDRRFVRIKQDVMKGQDSIHAALSNLSGDLKRLHEDVKAFEATREQLAAAIEEIKGVGDRFAGLLNAVVEEMESIKKQAKESKESMSEMVGEMEEHVRLQADAAASVEKMMNDMQLLNNFVKETLDHSDKLSKSAEAMLGRLQATVHDMRRDIMAESKEVELNIQKSANDAASTMTKTIESQYQRADASNNQLRTMLTGMQTTAGDLIQSMTDLSTTVTKDRADSVQLNQVIQKLESYTDTTVKILDMAEDISRTATALSGLQESVEKMSSDSIQE